MIKKIFCATDFSGAAEVAAMYAAAMAKAFNVELILFHSYEPLPIIVPETTMISTLEEASEYLEQKMDDIKLLIDPLKVLRIKKIIVSGSAVPNIIHEIEASAPDLVILGMKEKGKTIRKWFGTTVTGVVRHATVPIIIVPEEAVYHAMKTIALATEMDLSPDDDPIMFSSLIDIGKYFHSKLFMIRVAPNATIEALELLKNPSTLMHLTKALHPEFDCISGSNIEESLNAFIEKKKVDLLVLLGHHRSLLDRIWYQDVTRGMIFHTKVPLMIIPQKHTHTNTPADKVQRAC